MGDECFVAFLHDADSTEMLHVLALARLAGKHHLQPAGPIEEGCLWMAKWRHRECILQASIQLTLIDYLHKAFRSSDCEPICNCLLWFYWHWLATNGCQHTLPRLRQPPPDLSVKPKCETPYYGFHSIESCFFHIILPAYHHVDRTVSKLLAPCLKELLRPYLRKNYSVLSPEGWSIVPWR